MEICSNCNEYITGDYRYHIRVLCSKIINENVKCLKCNRLFKNHYLYKKHSNLIHSGSITCSKCNKTYKNKNSYYAHNKYCLRNKRTGNYACIICNKFFRNEDLLFEHNKLHLPQLNYACDICNEDFSNYDDLNVHKKIHNNKILCPKCNKEFVKSYFEEHYEKCNGILFCCLCNKKYKNIQLFQNHKIIHMNVELLNTNIEEKLFEYKNIISHIL